MAAAHRKDENRNITRLDYERTRGYWVRFEGAHRVSRLFSDGVHGGKAKALAEARRFRDAWVLSHDLTRRFAPQSLPGPGRIVKREIFQRKSWSWVWEAYIRLERGKGHAVTRYSIAKWGSAEAKRLCEVWLKKKQKEQKATYALLDGPAPDATLRTTKPKVAKTPRKSAKKASKATVRKSVKKASKATVRKSVKKASKATGRTSVKKA
jgi:hypothetical protein